MHWLCLLELPTRLGASAWMVFRSVAVGMTLPHVACACRPHAGATQGSSRRLQRGLCGPRGSCSGPCDPPISVHTSVTHTWTFRPNFERTLEESRQSIPQPQLCKGIVAQRSLPPDATTLGIAGPSGAHRRGASVDVSGLRLRVSNWKTGASHRASECLPKRRESM